MSITQDLMAVVSAADALTQEVSDKITTINQTVSNIQTSANNIVAGAAAQLNRARIGTDQTPYIELLIEPTDDAGALVKQAFADGNKHVHVKWELDGQDRHWNTLVEMPVGTTLTIAGPACAVGVRLGNVRTGRACYANGGSGGTSENGSPMIFRNLEVRNDAFPAYDHFRVWDETALIQMAGNNVLVWGDGTYVHDQGGMMAMPFGNGLIRIASNNFDMPCYVGGGGHYCQFYLSGPLVNNCGGGSTCEMHITSGYFNRVTSDGPVLNVDKGFKRLMNNGIAGVTSNLLNIQPYEVTQAQAAYNDNLHADYGWGFFTRVRGTDTESGFPRVIGNSSWALPTGWVMGQINCAFSEVAKTGLYDIEGSQVLLGTN